MLQMFLLFCFFLGGGPYLAMFMAYTLRHHSWQFTGDHRGYWGSNTSQQCARHINTLPNFTTTLVPKCSYFFLFYFHLFFVFILVVQQNCYTHFVATPGTSKQCSWDYTHWALSIKFIAWLPARLYRCYTIDPSLSSPRCYFSCAIKFLKIFCQYLYILWTKHN